MFSTPLISCSIGATTVAATTSALAPGYWPLTLTTGGAISGYWATGSRPRDTAPTMTKTIETTAAKIGRSMKKWEIRIGASIGLGGRARRRRLLGGHLGAGARAHQAVDHDPVVGRDALPDHAQPPGGGVAQRHVFLPRGALRIDHHHELARLLG